MEIRDKMQMLHMASENILHSIETINGDEETKTKSVMEMVMVLNSCSELVSHAFDTANAHNNKKEAHQVLNINQERIIELHDMLHKIHDPLGDGGYSITLPEFTKFRAMVILVVDQLLSLITVQDPRDEILKLQGLKSYHDTAAEKLQIKINKLSKGDNNDNKK